MLAQTKRQLIIGTVIMLAGVFLYFFDKDGSSSELMLWLTIGLFIGGFVMLSPALTSAVAQMSNKPNSDIQTWLKADGWEVTGEDRSEGPASKLPPHLLWNKTYKPMELLWTAKRVIDDRTFEIFFRHWKYVSNRQNETWWLTFDLHVTLTVPLPGWVRAEPLNWNTNTKATTPLESNDFNEAVDVNAHPDKLAFTVFSPEVMQWYLETSSRPFVHIEGDTLVIMPNEPDDDSTEKIHQLIHQSVREIEYMKKKLTGFRTA